MKNSTEESPLPWTERCLSSEMFEYIIENRSAVIVICLIVISLFVTLGFYLSRHQESSITQLCNAQHAVNTLTSVEASVSEKKEALHKLEDIVAVQPLAAAAFSGTVAQEQLIFNIFPPNALRFTTAHTTLLNNDLVLQSRIPEFSLLYAEGKKEELLSNLTLQLERIEQSKTESTAPQAYTYLLLQKAAVLRDLHRPNGAVVDELERMLSLYPEVNICFERIFSGNTQGLISFLKSS